MSSGPPAGALAISAAAGPETLDLPCLRGRHVVCATPHLPHQSLLLDLAAKLAKRLFEVLRILYDYLQELITSFSNLPAPRPRIIGEPGTGRHSIPCDGLVACSDPAEGEASLAPTLAEGNARLAPTFEGE